MPNALIVLNAPRQQELDRFMSLNNLARSRDISLFFLTRHLFISDLAFPIFGSIDMDSRVEINEDDLAFATKVIGEEIINDRQFVKSLDFRYRHRSRLPIHRNKLYAKIARRFIGIIQFTNPQFVATGAPDNWISVSIDRLCSHLSIDTGNLAELAFSKVYLVCDGSRLTNSKITQDLFCHEVETTSGPSIEGVLRLANVRDSVVVPRDRSLARRIGNLRSILTWEKFYLTEVLSHPSILFKGYEFSHPRIPFVYLWKQAVTVLVRRINSFILMGLVRLGTRSFLNAKGRRCLVMLHVSPEAGPLVLAREFTSQIDFALRLKESLSEKFAIYIKEHPSQDLGLRPLLYYFRFHLQGFKLVPRGLFPENLNHSRDLIATLTGSVALEALDFNCQVILANSNSWYSMLPNTILLEDLQNHKHVSVLEDTFKSPISSSQALSVISKLDCVITAPNDDSAEILMIEKSIT